MDHCSPAHTVYGGPDPFDACLPYTGHPLLGLVLLAAMLIGIGLALRGAQLMMDDRAARASTRRRAHGNNPLI